MPLPAPVTIATFPDELMFVSQGSTHAGELSRPFHIARDALRGLERAPAGVPRRGLVREQRRADVERELLAHLGIGGEQPAERLGRKPVVEVIPLHALFRAQRRL